MTVLNVSEYTSGCRNVNMQNVIHDIIVIIDFTQNKLSLNIKYYTLLYCNIKGRFCQVLKYFSYIMFIALYLSSRTNAEFSNLGAIMSKKRYVYSFIVNTLNIFFKLLIFSFIGRYKFYHISFRNRFQIN